MIHIDELPERRLSSRQRKFYSVYVRHCMERNLKVAPTEQFFALVEGSMEAFAYRYDRMAAARGPFDSAGDALDAWGRDDDEDFRF